VWCQILYKGVTITCSTLQMCVLLIINEQQTTSITAAGAHSGARSSRVPALLRGAQQRGM
jgi:hypothetical protein